MLERPASTAPASAGVGNLHPGPHGGNMDHNDVRVGARVSLPVFVPGALLALGLSRHPLSGYPEAGSGTLRRAAAGVGDVFEVADRAIRRWQFASISLLMLVLLLGGSLAADRG